MFKAILRSFSAFPIFDNRASRQRPIVDQKQNLELKFTIYTYRAYFWPCLRLFCDHSVHFQFQQTCASKTARRRVKRIKIWALGESFTVYRGTFDVIRCISNFR